RSSDPPQTATLQPAIRTSPSPLPSPTPLVTVQPPFLNPVVSAAFAEPAVGARLEMTVLEVRSPDARCITHELSPVGQFQEPAGLYYTNCRDWEAAGLHISLFAVQVRKTSPGPVRWRSGYFMMVARKGAR